MQRGTVRGRTNGRENALSVSQTQLPKLAAFVHNLSLLIIDQEQKVTTRPTYTTTHGAAADTHCVTVGWKRCGSWFL